MGLSNQYINAINSAIGKQITQFSHIQYSFNGIPEEVDYGPIEFQLMDNVILTMKLAGDGQSVIATNMQLEVVQGFILEGGGQCKWERINVRNIQGIQVINLRISSIEALIEERKKIKDEILRGWIVYLENGNYLCYYNEADEAKLLVNTIPKPSNRGEILSQREII
jgi:hypothetical protein